jgi:O-antigen/teichoic acid export membrane protein
LLLRHGCSLGFVIAFGGTLHVFVLGQLVGAAIALAASRLVFVWQHRDLTPTYADRSRGLGATSIAVMIYTLAGACAMQLDKVLLSALASPVDTGPYFLASTLSLVPITFLASPISQFVQPKLIASLAAGRHEEAQRWVMRLTIAIIACAVLPGIGLGLLTSWLVPFWLHGSVHQSAVSAYTTLLMPGASLGALGLVPAIVLIARRDYRAMAMISAVLSMLVLSTTAWLARHGTIAGVCIAYAAYHTLAALALWWRAARIEPWFSNPFAIGPRIANGATTPTTRRHAPNPNDW